MSNPEDILGKVQANWNKVEGLIAKVGEPRKTNLKKLISHFENRLVTTPASSKTNYYGAYLGGLIQHSLKTTGVMIKMMQALDIKVPIDYVIMVGLFHDLGKVGSLEHDLFLEQKSDWHLKQGNLYEFNKDVKFMPAQMRSLYLLQHFGVQLTEDEFTAIFSNNEEGASDIQSTSLSLLLQQACKYSILETRGKTNIID